MRIWSSLRSISFARGAPARLPNPAAGISTWVVESKITPSVVLLSYNHLELTSRALASIIKSSAPFEKIFLIHNGSDEDIVKTLFSRFPTVEHVILKKNQGYAGGANFGLNEAFKSSDWVFFLTNDCVLTNFEFPEPAFQGMLAPRIEIRKTGRVDSLGGKFKPGSAKLSHCRTEAEFHSLLSARGSDLPYIPGTAFLIHKAVFLKLGGFQESLGTYWEDVDFSVRAFLSGFKLGTCSGVTIEHGVGKTCHKNPLYTLFYFQRNRKLISFRYASTWEKPILVFRILFTHLKLAFRLIKSGRRKDLPFLFRALIS